MSCIEIDLDNCDACHNTRVGYIVDINEKKEVPCWHCEDNFIKLKIDEPKQ